MVERFASLGEVRGRFLNLADVFSGDQSPGGREVCSNSGRSNLFTRKSVPPWGSPLHYFMYFISQTASSVNKVTGTLRGSAQCVISRSSEACSKVVHSRPYFTGRLETSGIKKAYKANLFYLIGVSLI